MESLIKEGWQDLKSIWQLSPGQLVMGPSIQVGPLKGKQDLTLFGQRDAEKGIPQVQDHVDLLLRGQ